MDEALIDPFFTRDPFFTALRPTTSQWGFATPMMSLSRVPAMLQQMDQPTMDVGMLELRDKLRSEKKKAGRKASTADDGFGFSRSSSTKYENGRLKHACVSESYGEGDDVIKKTVKSVPDSTLNKDLMTTTITVGGEERTFENLSKKEIKTFEKDWDSSCKTCALPSATREIEAEPEPKRLKGVEEANKAEHAMLHDAVGSLKEQLKALEKKLEDATAKL